MLKTLPLVALMALVGCASRGVRPAPLSLGVVEAPAEPVAPAPVVDGWTAFGRSVQGRPLLARTIGTGPLRVLLIGGIHGNEREGLDALDGVLVDLGAGSAPRLATLRVIRDANPDGSAAGTRLSARRVDLNRNWPASNFRARPSSGPGALSEPETRAVAGEIDAFDPHIVIVFHSIRSGPFVNFDGDGAALAGAFASAAARTDGRWRIVADMGYPTPGSLGSYVGRDRGVPTLTIEFERGQSAESARRAASAGIGAVVEAGLERACAMAVTASRGRWHGMGASLRSSGYSAARWRSGPWTRSPASPPTPRR